MALGQFLSNQGTQTGIIVDTIGGSVMAIQKVDISPLGADGTIWNGNVGVSSGTITSLPNLPGGTLNSVTITGGTVSVNELSGTINVGTAVLNDGTIDVVKNAGTIQGGSIVVTAGTINAGTINTGTINAGTVTIANVAGLFPANAALGDGDANPTTTKVGAMMMGYDGVSTWYRLNTANGASDTLGTGGIGNVTASEMRVLNGGTTWARLPGDGTNGAFVNVKVLPNIPGGSIVQTAGTLNTGTINAGTINAATVTGGSIVVTTGTFVGNGGSVISYGPAAAAAAASGNPLNIGGTDSGGTIRTIKVDSGGLQRIGIDSGTISVLPNLPQGSINVTAGTMIMTIGTINAGTINTGTINAGTINAATVVAGSIIVTNGTVIGNGGSMIAYGPAAVAAAASGNPLNIGGTDSGGTIRTIKVDSGGLQRIGIDSGTISVLPNLPQGSITVTTGTIVSVGTIGTLGLGTVVSTGTVNVGTINAGTINTGTINAGTINAGTFQQNPIPTVAHSVYGTHGTTGVSLVGTLVGGTGSGAGTEIFVTSVSMSIPSTGGSQDVSIGWGTAAGTFHSGTSLIVRGNFPAGGGIQKTFEPPINSGTNAQLGYFQAGAGTVDIAVSYILTPSTL